MVYFIRRTHRRTKKNKSQPVTHKQGHNGKDGGNDEVRYETDNDTSYDEDDENNEELEEECMVDYSDSSAEIAKGARNSSNSEVDDQGTEQPEARRRNGDWPSWQGM